MGIRSPQIYFSRPTKVRCCHRFRPSSSQCEWSPHKSDDDEAHGVVPGAGGPMRPDPRDRRVRTAPATPTVRQGARPSPATWALLNRVDDRDPLTLSLPPSTRRSRTFPRISSPPSARSGSSRRADRPPPACSATGYGRRPARTRSRSRHHSWTAPKPPTDRASPRPATRPRWDRAWMRHPRPRTRRP